jgi:hypothetical protein
MAAANLLVASLAEGLPEEKAERDAEVTKRLEWRLTIYTDGRDDEVRQRMDRAIAELERSCRKVLMRA